MSARHDPKWPVWLPPVLAAALLLVGLFVASKRRGGERLEAFSASRERLGTWITVTVVASEQAEAGGHLTAAFRRVEALEKILNAQSDNSDLARLNRLAAKEPVKVPGDLFRAIRAGVKWHERSHGCFDIAASPLIELWLRCGRANRLPAQGEIAKARRLVGANRLVVNETEGSVRFPIKGMRLHLGGLGKGYCADAVVKVLTDRGAASALVAMSGDIYALGVRPDGKPWRVGVQDPRKPKDPKALMTVLALTNMAVSTSGDYQRFVEIQGRRYSHIVDPRTGRTADKVPSVTVIGPDTLTTDILGTGLSVLGVAEGLRLVESIPGVEALFITFDEKEAPVLTRSSGFSRYEAEGKDDTDYRR